MTNKKAIFSWCLYDWANSAFSLTVMAGFFPVFFKTYWCAGVEATVSTARLGLGNASAGLAVALLSPMLGALADVGGAKKKLLGVFVILGVSATGALFFIGHGDWATALIFFVVASIGFNCANLFYDSLLTEVTEKEHMDWVSSLGYSLGYLGCGLLFLFNVFMVKKPSLFGIDSPAKAVQLSFLTASVWWFVFSAPLFIFVKERLYSTVRGLKNIFFESFGKLRSTFHKIISNRPMLLFLLAYWMYIDGVHTFVLMAVDFGMSIGLSSTSMMVALLVVQFVAFPSALLFGLLAHRLGAFTMILAGIIIYILVSGIGALTLQTHIDYIILAGITGLAQGGIQALSRSYFGKMIPPSESAEYFGFFNVVGRFAVIFGPAVVGTIALVTRRAGIESAFASRIGMSSVSILFLGGALLLIWAELKKRAVV